MIDSKKKVHEVAHKINSAYTQIVIDLFQDRLDELLDEDEVTPDSIVALNYSVGILIEVFNPVYEKDIELLKELEVALDGWEKDAAFVNRSLGLDPNQ